MIKPTVGRIVWFYVAKHKKDAQPLAAIVSHVHSDTCVNLCIIMESGQAHANPPTSIRLVQEGEKPPVNEAYCTWMPYQVGQAKKHNGEQLAKLMAEVETLKANVAALQQNVNPPIT